MNNNNGQSAAKLFDNFKPIPGFENSYLISKDGDVYSLISNKMLKPSPHIKDGYLQLSLKADNGKNYTYRVHRLVAMTYIENPNNLSDVNHIDFNRINNYVENLEWISHSNNIKHTRDAGRYDCIYNQTKKAYVFTNIYNEKSFTIIGYKNLAKILHLNPGNNSVIHRNANTGNYIARGVLKGFKIDIVELEVRRPTVISGVETSVLEAVGIPSYNKLDEDMASSYVKA